MDSFEIEISIPYFHVPAAGAERGRKKCAQSPLKRRLRARVALSPETVKPHARRLVLHFGGKVLVPDVFYHFPVTVRRDDPEVVPCLFVANRLGSTSRDNISLKNGVFEIKR